MNTGGKLKHGKPKSKNKFSSLDINSTFEGKSFETKFSSNKRHGFQTLGKVRGIQRIPQPTWVPSILSQSGMSCSTTSTINHTSTEPNSAEMNSSIQSDVNKSTSAASLDWRNAVKQPILIQDEEASVLQNVPQAAEEWMERRRMALSRPSEERSFSTSSQPSDKSVIHSDVNDLKKVTQDSSAIDVIAKTGPPPSTRLQNSLPTKFSASSTAIQSNSSRVPFAQTAVSSGKDKSVVNESPISSGIVQDISCATSSASMSRSGILASVLSSGGNEKMSRADFFNTGWAAMDNEEEESSPTLPPPSQSQLSNDSKTIMPLRPVESRSGSHVEKEYVTNVPYNDNSSFERPSNLLPDTRNTQSTLVTSLQNRSNVRQWSQNTITPSVTSFCAPKTSFSNQQEMHLRNSSSTWITTSTSNMPPNMSHGGVPFMTNRSETSNKGYSPSFSIYQPSPQMRNVNPPPTVYTPTMHNTPAMFAKPVPNEHWSNKPQPPPPAHISWSGGSALSAESGPVLVPPTELILQPLPCATMQSESSSSSENEGKPVSGNSHYWEAIGRARELRQNKASKTLEDNKFVTNDQISANIDSKCSQPNEAQNTKIQFNQDRNSNTTSTPTKSHVIQESVLPVNDNKLDRKIQNNRHSIGGNERQNIATSHKSSNEITPTKSAAVPLVVVAAATSIKSEHKNLSDANIISSEQIKQTNKIEKAQGENLTILEENKQNQSSTTTTKGDNVPSHLSKDTSKGFDTTNTTASTTNKDYYHNRDYNYQSKHASNRGTSGNYRSSYNKRHGGGQRPSIKSQNKGTYEPVDSKLKYNKDFTDSPSTQDHHQMKHSQFNDEEYVGHGDRDLWYDDELQHVRNNDHNNYRGRRGGGVGATGGGHLTKTARGRVFSRKIDSHQSMSSKYHGSSYYVDKNSNTSNGNAHTNLKDEQSFSPARSSNTNEVNDHHVNNNGNQYDGGSQGTSQSHTETSQVDHQPVKIEVVPLFTEGEKLELQANKSANHRPRNNNMDQFYPPRYPPYATDKRGRHRYPSARQDSYKTHRGGDAAFNQSNDSHYKERWPAKDRGRLSSNKYGTHRTKNDFKSHHSRLYVSDKSDDIVKTSKNDVAPSEGNEAEEWETASEGSDTSATATSTNGNGSVASSRPIHDAESINKRHNHRNNHPRGGGGSAGSTNRSNSTNRTNQMSRSSNRTSSGTGEGSNSNTKDKSKDSVKESSVNEVNETISSSIQQQNNNNAENRIVRSKIQVDTSAFSNVVLADSLPQVTEEELLMETFFQYESVATPNVNGESAETERLVAVDTTSLGFKEVLSKSAKRSRKRQEELAEKQKVVDKKTSEFKKGSRSGKKDKNDHLQSVKAPVHQQQQQTKVISTATPTNSIESNSHFGSKLSNSKTLTANLDESPRNTTTTLAEPKSHKNNYQSRSLSKKHALSSASNEFNSSTSSFIKNRLSQASPSSNNNNDKSIKLTKNGSFVSAPLDNFVSIDNWNNRLANGSSNNNSSKFEQTISTDSVDNNTFIASTSSDENKIVSNSNAFHLFEQQSTSYVNNSSTTSQIDYFPMGKRPELQESLQQSSSETLSTSAVMPIVSSASSNVCKVKPQLQNSSSTSESTFIASSVPVVPATIVSIAEPHSALIPPDFPTANIINSFVSSSLSSSQTNSVLPHSSNKTTERESLPSSRLLPEGSESSNISNTNITGFHAAAAAALSNHSSSAIMLLPSSSASWHSNLDDSYQRMNNKSRDYNNSSSMGMNTSEYFIPQPDPNVSRQSDFTIKTAGGGYQQPVSRIPENIEYPQMFTNHPIVTGASGVNQNIPSWSAIDSTSVPLGSTHLQNHFMSSLQSQMRPQPQIANLMNPGSICTANPPPLLAAGHPMLSQSRVIESSVNSSALGNMNNSSLLHHHLHHHHQQQPHHLHHQQQQQQQHHQQHHQHHTSTTGVVGGGSSSPFSGLHAHAQPDSFNSLITASSARNAQQAVLMFNPGFLKIASSVGAPIVASSRSTNAPPQPAVMNLIPGSNGPPLSSFDNSLNSVSSRLHGLPSALLFPSDPAAHPQAPNHPDQFTSAISRSHSHQTFAPTPAGFPFNPLHHQQTAAFLSTNHLAHANPVFSPHAPIPPNNPSAAMFANSLSMNMAPPQIVSQNQQTASIGLHRYSHPQPTTGSQLTPVSGYENTQLSGLAAESLGHLKATDLKQMVNHMRFYGPVAPPQLPSSPHTNNSSSYSRAPGGGGSRRQNSNYQQNTTNHHQQQHQNHHQHHALINNAGNASNSSSSAGRLHNHTTTPSAITSPQSSKVVLTRLDANAASVSTIVNNTTSIITSPPQL